MTKKVKQADGIVSQCSSRVAKSGSFAHSFYIGEQSYSIFSPDELSPVMDGDRVRFDYEVRRLRSGSRGQYCAVLLESLHIDAPHQIETAICGQVYILSNPSMRGLLKIGYTTRNVADRVSELSGQTNMPTPFVVEWILPITGDPVAVEQRAHIHLANKREGKEFFRVSLDEAKEACLISFAEIHPEQAEKLNKAHLARAEDVLQRREELARVKRQREKEKKMLEDRRAFWASSKGKWISDGRAIIVLHDFSYPPNRTSPSILRKLLGEKFEDYVDASLFASEHNGCVTWLARIQGRVKEKSIWQGQEFSSADEGLSYLALNLERLVVTNYQLIVTIPVCLIENPPSAPHVLGDSVSLPSLEGLVIRPDPYREERKVLSARSSSTASWLR